MIKNYARFESAFADASAFGKPPADRSADKIGFDWVRIGFDFYGIVVYGRKTREIGFVFSKGLFITDFADLTDFYKKE